MRIEEKDLSIEKRLNLIGITVLHDKKDRFNNPLLMKDGKELGYYNGWDACKKFLMNKVKTKINIEDGIFVG